MAPDLTVVVPTHNGAAWLPATLNSLLGQTCGELEVLVVDDGSTDGSAAIAEDHPLKCRVVRQPNMGVAVARNRGVLECASEWVAFLDQDDLWHESRWARLRDYIRETPDCHALLTTEQAFAVQEEQSALASAGLASWAAAIVPLGEEVERLCRSPGVLDVSGPKGVQYRSHEDVLKNTLTVTTSFLARRNRLVTAGLFAPHARAHDD